MLVCCLPLCRPPMRHVVTCKLVPQSPFSSALEIIGVLLHNYIGCMQCTMESGAGVAMLF